MTDILLTPDTLDANGRKVLLDSSVLFVKNYDSSEESWDKTGAGAQSWHREVLLPNDTFDSPILTDRWTAVDDTDLDSSTFSQGFQKVNFLIEEDEGSAYYTSDGKWRLTGDFTVKLYFDWESYYNEYRSVTHSYLKVGNNSENCLRISFKFDGEDGYNFQSEKAVDRDLTFFDFLANGAALELTSFAQADDYLALKITRVGGVIKTYVSTLTTDIQVGADISDAVFSEDLIVEFGVQAKEFNTYGHSFSKILFSGATSPEIIFFSNNRGVSADFPDRAIIAVDALSVSIIDADTQTLWMRTLTGGTNVLSDSDGLRCAALNGVIYFATPDGLIAFDFPQDRVFKYSGGSIQRSTENIISRNSDLDFVSYLSSTGTILSGAVKDVDCKNYSGVDYIIVATAGGVSITRKLTSGVYNCTQGSLPVERVKLSTSGYGYWSGYDVDTNIGQISFKSTIPSLVAGGTNTFTRTGVYTTDGALPFYGERVQDFDVMPVTGNDVLAVGTTDGLSVIGGFIQGNEFNGNGAKSYGVEAVADNPIQDPSFENYLGISWKGFYNGFHRKFNALRTTAFISSGGASLRLKFEDRVINSFYDANTKGGVYQDIDFTGVNTIYFDLKIEGTVSTNAWSFEIVVGSTIVKSYKDTDGPFTKLSDSADVRQFTGVHRMYVQLRFLAKSFSQSVDECVVYIDNFRTKFGDPDYRILPAGNASVKEVLLQYDEGGHKVYFASNEGYGSLDIDDNVLDYFVTIADTVEDSEVISADFSRIENED